jgi:peroxiredoxin
MKKFFFLSALSLLFLTSTVAQNVGNTAPDFSFKDFSGNDFQLSENLGKVVFIFTFGNSCPSCLAFGNETETMVNNVYGNRDDFVAVGVDFWNSSSSNTSVSNFAQQTGITYPLLVKGGDMAANYNTTYDRLLVVDHEGILRHKGNTLARNDLDNAIAVIEEYLGTLSTFSPAGMDFNAKAFPTPADREVNFSFNLDKSSEVEIELFNSLGQPQNPGFRNKLPAGRNEIKLSISSLNEGLYFYVIKQDSRSITTGRMIVKR